MSEQKLQRARELIEKRRYDQARAILQPLAIEDDVARDLLDRLNSIAPPSEKQRSSGCLGLSVVMIGIIVALVIGACICVVVVLVASSGATDDAAQEANDGFGAEDKPIPTGQLVKFDDFDVEIGEFVFPASQRVNQMNQFNESPAAGTEYALLSLTLTCKKSGSDVCRGGLLNIRLVDSAGEEWGEPTFLVLDPDLDSKEAIGGSSMTGWVGFEFPEQGSTVDLVKMWISGQGTLYADLAVE